MRSGERGATDYAIIDVETSGLNSESDEIVRLSALKIENETIAGRFSALIKPQKILTEEVRNFIGIANADLSDKPGISDVLPDFLNFIGDNALVAHNIGFNTEFINVALKKIGMPLLKNKTIDTLSLAKNKCESSGFSLREVAKCLGVAYKEMSYEEITFNVYEKLKNMCALG